MCPHTRGRCVLSVRGVRGLRRPSSILCEDNHMSIWDNGMPEIAEGAKKGGKRVGGAAKAKAPTWDWAISVCVPVRVRVPVPVCACPRARAIACVRACIHE